ncbi:MAG: peptidoglycan-binding protein [Ilumatobacteraceae bacterium]
MVGSHTLRRRDRGAGVDRDDGASGGPGHAALELQQLIGNRAVARLAEDGTAPQPVSESAAIGESGQAWIRPGDRGPEVARVRAILDSTGVAGTPLGEGDLYDAEMLAAVRAFQTERGLDPDGIIGPLTWEAIDRESDTAAEVVETGTDHIGDADRPTDTELTAIEQALNPTSTGGGTGPAQDWDGRNDPAARDALRSELHTALQAHLDERTPSMVEREQAKAAGNVLSTQEQEGAGRAAKASVDAVFGAIASSAALTQSQEQARAAFDFTAGVNLLDASDTNVRTPNPPDLAGWMADTDDAAQEVQQRHHFNRSRSGQGEGPFFETLIAEFIAQGSNQVDLTRYDQYGFAFARPGPQVLTQTAVTTSDEFSNVPAQPGGLSDAERRRRWTVWQTLVHEYIHTLAHPEFERSHGGKRTLTEGMCELFTREVLLTEGQISPSRRPTATSPGGSRSRVAICPVSTPGSCQYDSGEYTGYVNRVDQIVAQVGMDLARAAFFLGHVELIGLVPGGARRSSTRRVRRLHRSSAPIGSSCHR